MKLYLLLAVLLMSVGAHANSIDLNNNYLDLGNLGNINDISDFEDNAKFELYRTAQTPRKVRVSFSATVSESYCARTEWTYDPFMCSRFPGAGGIGARYICFNRGGRRVCRWENFPGRVGNPYPPHSCYTRVCAEYGRRDVLEHFAVNLKFIRGTKLDGDQKELISFEVKRASEETVYYKADIEGYKHYDVKANDYRILFLGRK